MRNLIFATLVTVAGCQQLTTDNFINPPPGVPATCTAIADLPGCDQGSISYSCTSSRPDDVGSDAGKGDTAQLVCSDGTMGPEGTALYCCIPFSQYFGECAPDTTIPGCMDPAVGFSCTSQGDPNAPGDGNTPGPTTPSDTDPTIACGARQVGANGAAEYCCNTATIPSTCVVTAGDAACPGIAVGYECSQGSTPADVGAPLACAAGSAGSNGTPFCCVPFATGADTCVIDDAVGCAADEIPFTCDDTNTPDGLDPALACTPQAPGYCCTIQ